jgi:hypothetical protein
MYAHMNNKRKNTSASPSPEKSGDEGTEDEAQSREY